MHWQLLLIMVATRKPSPSSPGDRRVPSNRMSNVAPSSSPDGSNHKKVKAKVKAIRKTPKNEDGKHTAAPSSSQSEQAAIPQGHQPHVQESSPTERPTSTTLTTSMSRQTPPNNDATTTPNRSRRSHNSSSMVSSIVIRQRTEETLQNLQQNLRYASAELLRTLGHHLSSPPAAAAAAGATRPRAVGGISLPASAVGWLAEQQQLQQERERKNASKNYIGDIDATVHSNSTSSVSSTFVSWQSGVSWLLPRLTHLRISADPWPAHSSKSQATTTTSTQTVAAASVQELHHSLQYFHQLRYHPRVDVSLFSNLQVLLLDSVPSAWVVNLVQLQDSLQVLRVERASLNDLEAFLFLKDDNINGKDDDETTLESNGDNASSVVCYSSLTHLKLSRCSLGDATRGLVPPKRRSRENSATATTAEFIPPLSTMPNLVSLGLSHNSIRSETTLLACGMSTATTNNQMSTLDLSYNLLSHSLPNARQYCGTHLKTLLLTGNQIETANGLDQLHSLEHLALDDNKIKTWTDIVGLARLPYLNILKLKGNPLLATSSIGRKHVRVMLLDLFRERRWSSLGNQAATFRQLEAVLPVIDGKAASSRELKALQQRAFVTIPTTTTTPAPRAANGQSQETRIDSMTTSRAFGEVKDIGTVAEKETVVATAVAAENRLIMKRKNRKVTRAVINEGLPHLRSSLTAQSTKSKKAQEKTAGSREEMEAIITSASAPKVSFTIMDLLCSLAPASTTQQELGLLEGANNTEKGSDHGSNAFTESGAKDTENVSLEFEWPTPIEYLPEKNLYEEFVWNPPPISLGRKKKTKSNQKQRRRKGKRTKNTAKDGVPLTPATKSHEILISKDMVPAGSIDSTRDSASGSPNRNGAKVQQKECLKASPSRGKIAPSSPEVQGSADGSRSRQLSSVNGTDEPNGVRDNVESAALANSVAFDEKPQNMSGSSDDKDDASDESFTLRSVSTDGEDENDLNAPASISGAAFPAMTMEAGEDDANSTYGSIATSKTGMESKNGAKKSPRVNMYQLAEAKSKFLGLEQERNLKIMDNLEAYFKSFVFPNFVPDVGSCQLNNEEDTWQTIFFRYPRIQLLSKDRATREQSRAQKQSLQLSSGETDREQLVRVWKEDVVACGKPSLRRLSPNRTAHFGFHGDLSWVDGKVKTVSECRQVIICLSDTCLYVISDNDSLTAKEQAPPVGRSPPGPQGIANVTNTLKSPRKFPAPIPPDATFSQALWPHAVVCHPLNDITGITIGFGFQRMTLRVRNSAYPSAIDFTYQLLTSNKMRTVELLQELQGLVKEVKLEVGRTSFEEEAIKIDNDDKQFLDTLAATVAPEPLGAVLHYQILKQRWKHGQRGAVSRICVVTDSKIFLLDEDYVGDGSVSLDAVSGRRLGSPVFRLIDTANLQQIAEVKAADADPNAITIVIRPTQKLLRTHRWRLLCRDRNGAEKLVEDVRKGMSLVE